MVRTTEQQSAMNDRDSPVASLFGDKPEEIAKGPVECSKYAEVFSADLQRLIHEHPLKWVGAYRGRVFAKADGLSELMKNLKHWTFPRTMQSFNSLNGINGR